MSQFLRYGIVGLVSNGLLYVVYFLLTYFTVAPEIAATIAYVLGVSWTYIINRGWSFKSETAHSNAAPKYAATYFMGYFITVGTLAIGYRVLGIPHLITQILAIGVTAIAIFLLLKFWVFAVDTPNE